MKTFQRLQFVVALSCTLGGWTHADPIYKWVDNDGGVHFGSVPTLENKDNARRFDINPRLLHGSSPNPQAELETRIVQYKRYIELLRDMRAAELGISREELDALEKAGLIK